MKAIAQYAIDSTSTIRDAMGCIDRNGQGIALVLDGEQRLLGTISDGDIRRAILKDLRLDVAVGVLLEERQKAGRPPAITAPFGTSEAELLRLMTKQELRQIPIVDPAGRVVDVAFTSDLVREYELPLTAVIMAGGFGTRLRPLTENTPKPMLPVGDRPILERTIEQLKKVGIRRVNLTTHYKPEVITDHFGNGERYGVRIKYVHEDSPLGTAGALGLLGEVDGPVLVINGDILTRVDFRAMLEYHQRNKACLTVGVRRYDVQVPYGVVECLGEKVCKVSEKPRLHFLVNAGIYLLEPSALQCIPNRKTFDMPELIELLISEGHLVVGFPIVEYWRDIGRPTDYETAQEDVLAGRI